MKGLKRAAKLSKCIKQDARFTWMTIYYRFDNDTVYTEPGADRSKVGQLIRENTEQEIKEYVERWKRV